MLRKLGAVISLLIIFCCIAYTTLTPVFGGYADTFEVYLSSASSLAEIKSVSLKEYAFTRGIKGESVRLDAEGFELEKVLKGFNAELRFSENTSDSEIYYAYSPKIRNYKTVKGQKINLHIVIASERVVLGSPLIFGSF